MSAPDTANPPVAARIAALRDLVNNQNVNGLSAGQATAIAGELDAILAAFGAVKPADEPPAPPPQPAGRARR